MSIQIAVRRQTWTDERRVIGSMIVSLVVVSVMVVSLHIMGYSGYSMIPEIERRDTVIAPVVHSPVHGQEDPGGTFRLPDVDISLLSVAAAQLFNSVFPESHHDYRVSSPTK